MKQVVNVTVYLGFLELSREAQGGGDEGGGGGGGEE